MKLRSLLWALILVVVFYYVTSMAHWNVGKFVRQTASSWSSPNAANTAGFSTDEVNNIDIYKAAHLATVNITSIVYREGWFFQLYPGKDTGSGFIINPDGRILTNYHVVSTGHQLTVTLPNKKQYKARVLVIAGPTTLRWSRSMRCVRSFPCSSSASRTACRWDRRSWL